MRKAREGRSTAPRDDRNPTQLVRNMKKRPQEEYSENVDKSNTPLPNSRAAELFKESNAAMLQVSNLALLLKVVDLDALKYGRVDFHEAVSHAFRAFGEELSNLALKALNKLEEAEKECGLDHFN